MVILRLFGRSSWPILKLMEDIKAVLYPASSKTLPIKCTVVDLPSVPVAPITFIFLLGNPYKIAPKKASLKWYQPIKKSGINFLSKVFIINLILTEFLNKKRGAELLLPQGN